MHSRRADRRERAQASSPPPRGSGSRAGEGAGPILTALLAGVVSLADIESGAIYSAEDGGMLLRLAAQATGGAGPSAPLHRRSPWAIPASGASRWSAGPG